MSLPQAGRDSGADLRDLREDEHIQALSLEAQTALLPYALAFFGVGLPIFVWVASYASNAAWVFASLAIFAINWGAFYALVNAVRRDLDLAADVRRRTRLNIMAGLLWSTAIAQVSLFAMNAGPAREPLLLIAAGAAVICMVFTSPCLPELLVIGPTAAAGPLTVLFLSPDTRHEGSLTWGAVALAGALALVLNRMFVRQFALSRERQKLLEAHTRTLAETDRLARSKSDLLATLSHEIRNGLTGVVHVLAAAAGAGGRAAPSREQLNAALEAARDLTSALDATLDSENADAGRLSVKPSPFDAAKLANDLVLLNRPQAAAKSLEIGLHVDEDLAEPSRGAAVADAVRARQVLAQLIGNAIKYTIRGRIEVRVRRLAADRIRVEVADTGPGLAADELVQAFTPFVRIERTSAGAPGAGLGLSLAQKLAALMGGELTAESAPGVGSCFSLDLPYDAAASAAPDAPVERMSARSMRVLMVETDGLQAAMMRASLEQLGHQVVHVQRIARLPEMLQVCDADLVIAGDCGGETTTGDVIRTVRAAAASPSMVIAVIEGDAADAADCLAAGADQIVRRPVTVANLARALTALGQSDRLHAVRSAA